MPGQPGPADATSVAIGAASAFFAAQAAGVGSTPSSVTGPVATVSAAAETTTTIENEKFRITFTNKGAQVQHWILKHYTDPSGKPLDMVQQDAASRFGLPLSLFTYDNALTTQLNTALYEASTRARCSRQTPSPSATLREVSMWSRLSPSTPAM